MKVLSIACCLAVASLATAAAQTAPAAKTAAKPAAKAQGAATAARTVELTVSDNMKFDKTEIAAKPGETLRIVLKSTGTMPKAAMGHNFVVVKPTVDLVEFNKAAFTERENEFIPPSMKAGVIANTVVVGPGETVETTFKVPAAGSYPFLCSFPGHFALGMRGTLIVK